MYGLRASASLKECCNRNRTVFEDRGGKGVENFAPTFCACADAGYAHRHKRAARLLALSTVQSLARRVERVVISRHLACCALALSH